MPPIDLVVTGSVAVTLTALDWERAPVTEIWRLPLLDAGLVGTHTVIVTTVHDQQVLDEVLPESEHDCRVDHRHPDPHHLCPSASATWSRLGTADSCPALGHSRVGGAVVVPPPGAQRVNSPG